MKDRGKTKAQLIEEMAEMRLRIAELEKPETERAEAERALRESEEKYRSIFENATAGMYRSRSDGSYIDVNAAFARIFGYDSAEELENAITDIGRQLYTDHKKRDECIRIVQQQGEAIFNIQAAGKMAARYGFLIMFGLFATPTGTSAISKAWLKISLNASGSRRSYMKVRNAFAFSLKMPNFQSWSLPFQTGVVSS